MLFKRKKTIFFVWFSCIVIALAYSIIVKPIFEASTRILVKVGRENVYNPHQNTGGVTTPVVDSDLETQVNSEVEILKSRLLLEKVLTTIGPKNIYAPSNTLIASTDGTAQAKNGTDNSNNDKTYNNALRRLQKDLKMEGIKKSNVIQISFRHTDPKICALVLNTLVKLYLEQHLKIHQASLSFNFFRERGDKLTDELRLAEAALNNFKSQHKIDSSPEEQKRLLVIKESEMRSDLIRTENLEKEAKTRLDHYKSRTKANPAYLNVNEVILKSEADLKEAHIKIPLLLGQLNKYRRELNQLTEAEDDFLHLQQQVELSRQNLRLHQTNLQEESYLAALDKDKVSNLSVIDPARPPLEPVTPKSFLLILSIFLGGIASVGLALYLEYINEHIETAQDVEQCFPGLPLLASIPDKRQRIK